MRTIEPYKIGGRAFFAVSVGIDSHETHGKCVACQRSLPLNNFLPAPERFFRSIRWGDSSDADRRDAVVRRSLLFAVCQRCMRQQRTTDHSDHPLYTPELDTYFRKLMNGLKNGASSRRNGQMLVMITKEDLLDRYLANDGRCEATGVQLRPYAKIKGKKNYLAPSVDRIDSDHDYTLSNIQIVAAVVNIMKNEMSMDVFTTWCQRVVNYQALKTEKLADEIEDIESGD